MKDIVRELIAKYGEDYEKLKVLEELNELSFELWRDIGHKEASRMKILEERIDVELELAMLDEIYDFNEKDKAKMWELKSEKIKNKYLEV